MCKFLKHASVTGAQERGEREREREWEGEGERLRECVLFHHCKYSLISGTGLSEL